MPALMQIVAYGSQDVYLTGNPDITHFKMVYRRHTNFSLETIENRLSSNGFGERCSATISRNGDLVCGAYVRFELPDLTEKALENFALGTESWTGPHRRYMRWVDNVGHYLLKAVEVEINGHTIDKHNSDWLEIWSQLSLPACKQDGYRAMIGQDKYNVLGQNTGLQKDVLRTNNTFNATTNIEVNSTFIDSYRGPVDNVIVGRTLFVPLQFWFCRDWGLSLPLVALQNSEVRIHLDIESQNNVIMLYEPDSGGWVTSDSEMERLSAISDQLNVSLWVDYAFLDVDERRKFTHVSHEYLIEQLQYDSHTVLSGSDETPRLNNVFLNFDHPVKELVWVVKPFTANKEWCNFTNTQLRSEPPVQSWSTDQLDNGLSGLPVGDQAFIDIDVFFVAPLAQTNLTVVTDAGQIGGGNVYFEVNDATTFGVGDLVIVNDGNEVNNTTLMVSAIDGTTLHPTAFTLQNQAAGNFSVTNVLRIDRIAHTVYDITVNVAFDPIVTTYTLNQGAHVFVVNDSTSFITGDTVELENGVTFSVSSVDTLGHPTEFSLTSSGTLTAAQPLTQLAAINGNPNHVKHSLSHIVTYNDLINFSSYNMTRPYNSLGLAQNPVKEAQLMINNYKRFTAMKGMYFNLYQPYRHHTNVPSSPGINVYSFAIEPENSQPSGSCNFSRIDNARLDLWLGGLFDGGASGQERAPLQACKATVFALSYNILRIFCGMGAVAFNG